MTLCVRSCSIGNEKLADFGEIVVCLIFSSYRNTYAN